MKDEDLLLLSEKAHKKNFEFSMAVNESARSYASGALKTAVIINGGAAIALLTFIGNVYSTNETNALPPIAQLTNPIMWFAWGVALAAFAMSFGFFANQSTVEEVAAKDSQIAFPYFVENKQSKRWHLIGAVFYALTSLAGVGSLLMFICGMLAIRDAITLLQ
jgi:hypothetical protein